MSYIDQKYITLISSQLDRFRPHHGKFNFRCPYCGDSQTNSKKARGWLLPSKNSQGYYFFCHNCNANDPFPKFLKRLNYDLYKQYRLEHYQPDEFKIDQLLKEPLEVKNLDAIESLPTISSLNQYHHAKQYLVERKIPKEWFGILRYTDNYKKFVNTLIPEKFENTNYADSRIVIPFFDYDGKLFGFQGRALYNASSKYITIILKEGSAKLFNLNKVNVNKRYYVLEGAFDAMFLNNALAMAGASFSDLPNIRNAVIIYDNEPRNSQIGNLMHKCIQEKLQICIWPNELESKDINEMVLSGYTGAEIQNIIDTNTFEGLLAEAKFNNWKKYG